MKTKGKTIPVTVDEARVMVGMVGEMEGKVGKLVPLVVFMKLLQMAGPVEVTVMREEVGEVTETLGEGMEEAGEEKLVVMATVVVGAVVTGIRRDSE